MVKKKADSKLICKCSREDSDKTSILDSCRHLRKMLFRHGNSYLCKKIIEGWLTHMLPLLTVCRAETKGKFSLLCLNKTVLSANFRVHFAILTAMKGVDGICVVLLLACVCVCTMPFSNLNSYLLTKLSVILTCTNGKWSLQTLPRKVSVALMKTGPFVEMSPGWGLLIRPVLVESNLQSSC